MFPRASEARNMEQMWLSFTDTHGGDIYWIFSSPWEPIQESWVRSTHLHSQLLGITEKVRHGEKAHSLNLYPMSGGGTASLMVQRSHFCSVSYMIFGSTSFMQCLRAYLQKEPQQAKSVLSSLSLPVWSLLPLLWDASILSSFRITVLIPLV